MIGSAGALLGAITAKSLVDAGAEVLRGESAADRALPSRYYARRVVHPPLADRAAFQPFLLDYAARHPDHVLLPFDDEALLSIDDIRPQLDDMMPVAAPPKDATMAALDKARTIEVASTLANTIRPPLTTRVDPQSADASDWAGRYPVIVKPVTGTRTEGIRLARTPAELNEALRETAKKYSDALIQEKIEFRIERKFILYYLYDHAGELRGWYGQRFIAERKSIQLAGTSARVSGGVALAWESWFDEDLLTRGRRLMEALGWRGLGFIEGAFDLRDGLPYFFEINPRIGGTQALSLKEGVNFAHDCCLVAQGVVPPERLSFAEGVRAKRDLFSLLRTGDPSLMRLIVDPRWVSSTPAWSDPGPVLATGMRSARRVVSTLAKRLTGRSTGD
ncbi:MAG: hypothetical protein AAGG47_02960 [Pseudomonadota bacterium]